MFAHDIWKDYLWRQCHTNNVFWPTYKDLTDAHEFKKAATSPAQFFSAYSQATRCSEALPSTRARINLPDDIRIDDPEEDVYLVPGGRFIVIFELTRVSLWDMVYQEDAQEVQLRQVSSKEINELREVLMTCLASPTRIRFLFSVGSS